MEISNPSPLLTGENAVDKLHNAPETVELEENGNIAVIENEKVAKADESSKTRPIDQFFTQQARGDILSPIKPKITADADTVESLNLKLDDAPPKKPQSACIQPESFLTENTDMFEVNILEASVDSKLDTDQSQTDLVNEAANSRKRPQTEMEPSVFEVPRLTKHPHTDAPPVPEFREDSEPLIDFASETENVFPVAFPEGNGDDSAEPMSSEVTYTVESRPSMNEERKKEETKEGGESPIISIVRSIDEALDPLVKAIFPIMRRGTGINTAFVCISLLVASITYFYLRL